MVLQRLGLSGTCYWCTEAIFLSLKGVTHVEQGWISSFDENDWFSEGIIITPKLNKLLESHGEFMNKGSEKAIQEQPLLISSGCKNLGNDHLNYRD